MESKTLSGSLLLAMTLHYEFIPCQGPTEALAGSARYMPNW